MTDIVRECLEEAGFPFGSDEYWKQYNFCHASLDGMGIRAGLDERVCRVLQLKGLGKITKEGCQHWFKLMDKVEIILLQHM